MSFSAAVLVSLKERGVSLCCLLTLSPPIPLRFHTLPHWSNPLFLSFDIAQMSKIKNGGLDQCGTEPLKQQQFKATGVEGVNRLQHPKEQTPMKAAANVQACSWGGPHNRVLASRPGAWLEVGLRGGHPYYTGVPYHPPPEIFWN